MDALGTALARLTDDELAVLERAVEAIRPGPSPNLVEWIGVAVDRERHRRSGIDLPALPIEEAIPPQESAIALATASAMRDAIGHGAVRELFAAVVALLSAGTRH